MADDVLPVDAGVITLLALEWLRALVVEHVFLKDQK